MGSPNSGQDVGETARKTPRIQRRSPVPYPARTTRDHRKKPKVYVLKTGANGSFIFEEIAAKAPPTCRLHD